MPSRIGRRHRRFLPYIRPQRAYFIRILAGALGASILAALQPWPVKWLADAVTAKAPAPVGIIALSALVLLLLPSLLESMMAYSWTLGGRRMVYSLAEDLFARLQRRSLIFHSRAPVADAMARVTTDSWCVYQFCDALLAGPSQALLTLLLMMTLMARMDATMTLVTLVMAPCMVAASFWVTKPLQLAARLKRDIETRVQSHIQQTLTGIPVVQAFGQEQREQMRFGNLAERAVRAHQRGAFLGSLNGLSSGLIAALGSGAILWMGAVRVQDHRLTVGSLLAFVFYLNALQAPLKTLAGVHTTLLNFDASVDRVMEILDAPPEISERPDALTRPKLRGQVELDGVTFGYEPDRPVLRGISLRLEPGEIVALTGPSGAGKTTLAQLIPRFFDPWEGAVRVDGGDVRDMTLETLRAQVAMVLQEPFLFPISIADNIAFGKPGASRAEIEVAARAALAHDFIARLPQKYDTILGERGGTLSGGERQRLALARAWLKNAPILILDEPTSALDAATEELIFDAWERLAAGRATLVIAHRPSTIRRAQRVLALENGVLRGAS
ncbi:MAG TPA: ABC transporter ATP-binding protein [Verrucomicrobiae bacterium]|jgi:ATP-binding cassette subfamily B protein/subfamily B ATP-binding cassette protein MsbA|nr:ABC transporter ATP-binding protein [Verrucomicrobiae bacterium]